MPHHIKYPRIIFMFGLAKRLKQAWQQASVDTLSEVLENAISNNRVSTVQRVLRFGLDPNVILPESRLRPLAFALEFRSDFEVVKSLLDFGADPQDPFPFGMSNFSYSELVHMGNNPRDPKIVDLIENAEREAESKHGPRQFRRFPK